MKINAICEYRRADIFHTFVTTCGSSYPAAHIAADVLALALVQKRVLLLKVHFS